jgi:hypothetical protein
MIMIDLEKLRRKRNCPLCNVKMTFLPYARSIKECKRCKLVIERNRENIRLNINFDDYFAHWSKFGQDVFFRCGIHNDLIKIDLLTIPDFDIAEDDLKALIRLESILK